MSKALILAPSVGNAMGHELLSWSRGMRGDDNGIFCLPSHFLYRKEMPSSCIYFRGTKRKALYTLYQFLMLLDRRIWGLMWRGEIGVVHIYNSHGYPVSIIIAMLAKLFEIKLIVTLHDPDPHPGSRIDFVNNLLGMMTLRFSDVIHINSKCYILLVKARYRKAVCHIPLGSVASVFRDVVNECPLIDVLFFGRLEEYKGVGVLLDAHVRSGYKYNIAILGAGPVGSSIERRVDGMPNVLFENRFVSDDEIASYLRSSKVLVMPYIQATQSSLPLLAAHWGLGLVCSRLGGLIEDCEAVGGILVAPNDPDALLNGIELAFKNRTKSPVARQYSEISKRFSELYEEVQAPEFFNCY